MPSAATSPRDEQRFHDEAGVDLTLIRWTLSMTPAERLQTLQDFIDSITEMCRGGGAILTGDPPDG